MRVLEDGIEDINPVIFLNLPAFFRIMKVVRILGEIVGGVVTIAVVGGLAYSLFTFGAVTIQNEFFHHFDDTVQAGGITLHYKGVEPYNPWPWFPGHDRNGYAEVRLNDDDSVYYGYDNLNSLEGSMMITNSGGEKSQFNVNSKYDGSTSKKITKLNDALKTTGPNGKTLREIVEEEIQAAIGKKQSDETS